MAAGMTCRSVAGWRAPGGLWELTWTLEGLTEAGRAGERQAVAAVSCCEPGCACETWLHYNCVQRSSTSSRNSP